MTEAAEPSPADPPGAPSRLADFVELAKPGITALICLVAVGGFVLADPRSIDVPRLAILVATGASASAGAAMLNHYLDRDLDRRMKRTRGRPLPAERIAPEGLAAALGIALLAVGIGASTVFLNPLTGFSIFLGGLTYVVVYTLWLKRRSSWNIVVGGFAGSAPALAGSAAAVGGCTWGVVAFAGSAPARAGSAAAVGGYTWGVVAFAVLVFLWTPPHFWSLALLLKDDYARAGLPMLPRMDDPRFSGKVVVVSAALLVPAALLIGASGAVTWPVLVALLALGLLFVALTLPLWRVVSAKTARRGFLFSGPYLLLVIVALIANAPLVLHGFPTGL